mmetsp:Transcript_12969/g.31816  ORF Transcript_12969/g.31816 Transcript_12969/m.31816 type:complete len:248 (+) Transcript_12969:405-1148(+)
MVHEIPRQGNRGRVGHGASGAAVDGAGRLGQPDNAPGGGWGGRAAVLVRADAAAAAADARQPADRDDEQLLLDRPVQGRGGVDGRVGGVHHGGHRLDRQGQAAGAPQGRLLAQPRELSRGKPDEPGRSDSFGRVWGGLAGSGLQVFVSVGQQGAPGGGAQGLLAAPPARRAQGADAAAARGRPASHRAEGSLDGPQQELLGQPRGQQRRLLAPLPPRRPWGRRGGGGLARAPRQHAGHARRAPGQHA